MYSGENEKVKFVKPIDPINKNVEDWMGEVEDMMKASVRKALDNITVKIIIFSGFFFFTRFWVKV